MYSYWIVGILLFLSAMVIYQKTSSTFEIQEYHNLLTKDECNQIIQLAKSSQMVESHVVNETSLYSKNTEHRKSTQCWKNPSDHPVLKKLSDLSVEITGFPVSHQEMIQIVKYEPGGKFDAHYDACVHGDKICQQMNRGSTERRTTLIFYLNNGMVGGETEFVNLDLKIEPETGKGLLFWSTDQNNNLIKESKHRGNIIESGEKWIATVWSHGSPFV
jgi:prolyl 4-hydroxylase